MGIETIIGNKKPLLCNGRNDRDNYIHGDTKHLIDRHQNSRFGILVETYMQVYRVDLFDVYKNMSRVKRYYDALFNAQRIKNRDYLRVNENIQR